MRFGVRVQGGLTTRRRGCRPPLPRSAYPLARSRVVAYSRRGAGRPVTEGHSMRIESSVTTVSWIPSEAVSGPVLKGMFESGFTSYDDPPGDTIDDLEAWRAADAFRFANRLAAWVEIDDGRIVDCGYTGGGLMGSTTVRLAKLRATFEPVALADIQQEPELSDTERPLRADHRRPHRPPGAPARQAPAVRAVPRPDGLDHARAHHPRRRHVELRGRRRQQVPAPLGVRQRRRDHGQGRPRQLQGLVPATRSGSTRRGATRTRRRSSPRSRPPSNAGSR